MIVNSNIHLTTDTRIHCYVYGTDAPPILAIDGPDGSVNVSVFINEPAAVHADVTHALLAAVREYANAMEIYTAAHHP
ncbi:hypothetical protein [Streptomyces boncukensis]|uniref:Uncharacterized protein n=1 Tax=Streptomyces boncukensis TaxID=2711219 RepID=A0A6G4X868_9ACTN|nr:hypothetical protein [Streptomyces boncukensis]NGO73739.1 hypothetical protein [Streptomyces boncukensis]